LEAKETEHNDKFAIRKNRNRKPTHKHTHLQFAQADTQPKIAKEYASCQHAHRII